MAHQPLQVLASRPEEMRTLHGNNSLLGGFLNGLGVLEEPNRVNRHNVGVPITTSTTTTMYYISSSTEKRSGMELLVVSKFTARTTNHPATLVPSSSLGADDQAIDFWLFFPQFSWFAIGCWTLSASHSGTTLKPAGKGKRRPPTQPANQRRAQREGELTTCTTNITCHYDRMKPTYSEMVGRGHLRIKKQKKNSTWGLDLSDTWAM